MGVNRGKQFEDVIKEAFEKVPGCSIDRLHDQTNGFSGSSNICDFIVYRKPCEYYIECKSCYGNTLSINSNNPKNKYGAISNKQWEGLLEKSKIDGVRAGIIVWFIDHDVTYWVDIVDLECLKNSGLKSLNWKQAHESGHRICGNKKIIFFDYDMEEFLNDL